MAETQKCSRCKTEQELKHFLNIKKDNYIEHAINVEKKDQSKVIYEIMMY